jgi:hypothetical protein
MERRWLSFEFELGRDHDTLEQLVSKARQSYMHVGGKVSEAFVQRVEEASFRFPALSQRAIWEERIKPKLQEGKTAYLAVDAFRFEMARELSEAISGEFLITLDAAIATVPTITRIGMAALLPNAEKRFTVMPKSGKLAGEGGPLPPGDRRIPGNRQAQDRRRNRWTNEGIDPASLRLPPGV